MMMAPTGALAEPMAGYDIFLSNGDMLTTIAEKTVDTRLNSSLVLVGKGIPDYWSTNDQNVIWMLENFSAPTPPRNPLVGQTWHNSRHDRMAFYTGADWEAISTLETAADGLFDMLTSATNIDFTVTGSTPIFTAPDLMKSYCSTSLILVPQEPVTATTPPIIEVSASTAGDILSTRSVSIGHDDGFGRLPANSLCSMVNQINPTASLNITVPATGGEMVCRAYLFGLVIAATDLQVDAIGYGTGLYGRGLYQTDVGTFGEGLFGYSPYGTDAG
jgi:hypothetical protein